ncbi:MAG: sigma-70 family RNA polymerase sigma factor [Myxococcota bacterium]
MGFSKGAALMHDGSIPLTGCFADDEAAFRAAYARFHPIVRRLLLQVTRDEAEAEDLSQEVFVRLLSHRFMTGRPHDVRRWLLRVALNRGLNQLRSTKRRASRERAVGSAAGDGAYDLEAAAHTRQRQQQVRLVLAQLDPRDAKLLTLRHLGSSYAELAELIGVAPGSVGTLLVRAQRRFIKAHHQRFGTDDSGGCP